MPKLAKGPFSDARGDLRAAWSLPQIIDLQAAHAMSAVKLQRIAIEDPADIFGAVHMAIHVNRRIKRLGCEGGFAGVHDGQFLRVGLKRSFFRKSTD